MTNLLQSVRSVLGRWLPFLSSPSPPADPVAESLKGLNWASSEDEETTRRQADVEPTKGDGLATTIYHARPQNPFSEDF